MNNQTIKNTLNDEQIQLVNKVIMHQLSVSEEQLTPDARIEHDLGADSLDIVSIVMGLEEEFSITLSDDQSGEVKTVGDAYDLVARVLQASTGSHS
jgi:acyl carrier protein